MHAFNKILAGLTIIGFFIIQSCNNDNGDEQPLRTGVVVVNAGTFGNANGSLSLYDEKTQDIENYVVKTANGGSDIGAGIESMLGYGEIGIIICNATDKLEYIDLNTMKYVSFPTTSLTTPRYMAAYKGIGYISCWGPWSANWTLDESYVAILNISNGNIMDSVQCGSGPEGILIYDSRLYIANSYDSTITVYDVSDFSKSTISLDAAPQHMKVDANKVLWVSVTSGYGRFSADKTGLTGIETGPDHKIISKINITGISEEGTIAYDKTGHKLYILTAEAWPGTATEVLEFDTDTKKLNTNPIVSGENFSGLDFNSDTGKLYVADAAGFQGNGKIIIYDNAGKKLDEKTVAIGPTFFLFK
jgi:hypothetical protein